MERKEAIRSAYRLTGSSSFYDGMMTCSTLPGRLVCRLVWDMDKQMCSEYQEKALSGIPEDFSGRLLEVPVGTGILTMPLYQTLPKAEITCLDYSPDMMAQAKEKADRLGLQNVSFRQGDVGALPFEDGSFDAVLSLNGFHAFPDKEAAYRETFRVLRPGGTFCGCFYVSGACRRTDRLIRRAYEPMKFFTPPYETVDSLRERLNRMYSTVQLGNVRSIAWFVCRKGEERTYERTAEPAALPPRLPARDAWRHADAGQRDLGGPADQTGGDLIWQKPSPSTACRRPCCRPSTPGPRRAAGAARSAI